MPGRLRKRPSTGQRCRRYDAPITKPFFFMSVSNAWATENPVAVRIGAAGCHQSFSGVVIVVTKFVIHHASHSMIQQDVRDG
jgi:hypothetical protein